MGFLTGSATFERFRVTEDPTDSFGKDHLATLKKHRIGTSKGNRYETPDVGFTGGAHLLDTSFDLEKNIIGDAMHFGIRIDSCSIPGPIKRAWMHLELQAVQSDKPGSRPTKAQREEAKEAVEARCIDEAAKGNYQRMSITPVLWDSMSETLYLGSTSEKSNDVCLDLLNRAFGLEFSRVTSGKLAQEFAESVEHTEALYDASPSSFHPEAGGSVVWWNGMNDNYDYLGNEFLLWLWWHWETNSDMIALSDSTEVSGMFARSLSLDCPAGESGRESISSDSPVALPEAMVAIRMGKLPRKAGLTLVRDGEQYDFALKAETFSVGSARISQVGDSGLRDAIDRIESVRQLSETIDLLFEVFCQSRLGSDWAKVQKKIEKWLKADSAPQSRKAA